MNHDKFYLISPTDILISLLGDADEDIRNYLSTDLLWTGQFSDRSALIPGDEIALVQSLFLMNVSEMSQVAQFIQKGAGEDINFSSEFFNKFWKISELYQDNNVKEAMRDAAGNARFPELLSTVNDRVASYIRETSQSAVIIK